MSDMDKLINNRNDDWDNIEFNASSVGDYTIKTAAGTDTDTTKHLSLVSSFGTGRAGMGFVLRPSETVSIVSIGNKTFKNPITVTIDGFSVITHIKDFVSMVIHVDVANTMIRLLVF